MKLEHSFLACLLIMLALGGAASATCAETNAAAVRLTRGEVHCTPFQGAQTQARVGWKLPAGSTISTQGKDSYAGLSINQNDVLLVIGPETELRIVRLEFGTNGVKRSVTGKIKLVRGWMMGMVNNLGQGSNFTMGFPDGEMQSLDGRFVITAPGTVAVTRGKATVYFPPGENRQAVERRLEGGEIASRDFRRKLEASDKYDWPFDPEVPMGYACPSVPIPALPEPNFPRRKGL